MNSPMRNYTNVGAKLLNQSLSNLSSMKATNKRLNNTAHLESIPAVARDELETKIVFIFLLLI